MNLRGFSKYGRDAVLFAIGVMIVLHELGMPPYGKLDRPMSVFALIFGGLFCNGPTILAAITAWRNGGSTPAPSEPPGLPASSSEPSPAPSSGGS